MKKFYFGLLAAALSLGQASAQTILEEDFETGATKSQATPLTRGEGWTVKSTYSGTNMLFNWFNYYSDPESTSGSTISGAGCAACDGPTGGNNPDGAGPREEILISPELDLNDTYQLQFTWKVSPMNNRDNSRYDLQVRVITGDNLNTAETIFSIQNEQMLRESGVTVFPIDTWDLHTSKVDLSDWRGQKVKLAFVYKMFTSLANIAWIDDITVKKFTPATGPVAQVSLDRYDFKEVFIGEKFFSEVITLTNVGKNGLKITGMDLPQGISTTLNADAIDLRTYDNVQFQLAYEASMTTPASGDAIIHTTGGDVKIAFSAQKQFVPDGYMLETFNDYFPPAGWKNNGWGATNKAIEGEQSAYCSGGFSKLYLRSPRLDLSNGGKVKFTYYNLYDGEAAPEYDIELQVSYDGGDNWTTKWVSDYQNGLNQLLTEEVDLGMGTDESYIRFYYPAIESDDEGAYDHSDFTLDRVLLPNVYGADGVPGSCALIKPAQNALEVYPKEIVLEWGPAQFAKGYKVYVGTNNDVNNLIDGVDVGSALTYTIPAADYSTTYKWKVVAYNDKGSSTTASTWRFTTQADASVIEFPWKETFDACQNDVPTGWLATTDNEYENRKWGPNSIYGYNNTCLYTGWMNAGKQSTLLSPEFNLPADGKSMSVSFYWGDEHPRSLKKDETGLLQKENVAGGNGASETVFEIFADGEWKQASYLSENYNADGETKYWRLETIDLTEYAGKKIQFRWINRALSGRHNGASIDEIVINGTVFDGVAFNHDSWDAGKVNLHKGNNSGTLLTIRNTGKNDLKIKEAKFNTDFFTTSLAAGLELKKGQGTQFDITFTAKEAAKQIEDVLTITFDNDFVATFPVKGETLAEDVLYYTFEMNPLEYDWKEDFTQIDVDKKVNNDLGYYETIVENDGGKYAFTQVTHYNANLTAHTGNHTIAACAPYDNSAADDWLISKPLAIAEGANFDFYARNLSTINSVFVGDNDLHSVEVLVSETSNTNTSAFKTVMNSTEMAYLPENEWHHFNVDLAAYVGKTIYIAVRHTTVSANAMAFFDDFTFSHVSVGNMAEGIQSLAAISNNAEVTVYNINGVQVMKCQGKSGMESLRKGIYVVKVVEGGQTKTTRIIRK